MKEHTNNCSSRMTTGGQGLEFMPCDCGADFVLPRTVRNYPIDAAMGALDRSGILPHVHEGLAQYIVNHRPVGGFLTSVLENDLFGAWSRADAENRVSLHRFVEFLTFHAPSICWGSPERVRAWLSRDDG